MEYLTTLKQFEKVREGKAVREALGTAAANNGGEVLFVAQHKFLTGCFKITSNVILNVKGAILASQIAILE
jgi:hypothetical protein